VREPKYYQQIILNEIEIHAKINAKSMLEKVMQKTLRIIKIGAQKGAKNHKKSIKNEVQKSDDFWKGFPGNARGTLGPEDTQFKRPSKIIYLKIN
jgi:hypothetical protein